MLNKLNIRKMLAIKLRVLKCPNLQKPCGMHVAWMKCVRAFAKCALSPLINCSTEYALTKVPHPRSLTNTWSLNRGRATTQSQYDISCDAVHGMVSVITKDGHESVLPRHLSLVFKKTLIGDSIWMK